MTKYKCPDCEYWTSFYPAWQTAKAELRKHRKQHSQEAFANAFPMPAFFKI